ncbi:uncharacterized protein LOC124909655 [Impatiens glandulifera]|uniref:uncharacterized protein LOC124909655 n=1 Tax=Impatiens glandulifera TaxID=253017 RepID=UPI001FB0ACB5|nr:uncharacterized protein LOC124909655 [Impatiens glandulifera]
MVVQKDGRVQDYAMQIVKILQFLHEDPKGKVVQADASQKKKGRKKKSAKKSTEKPANSEKTLSSDHSPKRNPDVFQPIPINTVHPHPAQSPSSRQTEASGNQETQSKSKENSTKEVSVHSENSKSPNKNLDEIMVEVGLRTSEVIVDVVQTLNRETEDDVTSLLKLADQVEVPGQSGIHSVEETANNENIIPPAQEGNIEENDPSGSAGNKSVPTETTLQSAQDRPADSTITPEGPSQVSKGKEVLIEDSLAKGKGALQTSSQTEIVIEPEVPISVEEEEEMYQKFLLDMNKEAEEMVSSYHLWVKLRCETKLSDMIPDISGNKYWEKLLELEEVALKITGTDVIQAAFSKTMAIQEYARLHAVEDAMREEEGAQLTPIESRMFEQFHTVRNNLIQSVDRLKAEWRDACKHVLTHADLFQSKPFFVTGESSKTAENRSSAPLQTDQAPALEQVKGVVVDTIISCLHKYSIATDEKIATVETNLTEIVRASVHSEIVETVQTSIKSMIAESISSDAETAKKLQDEDEKRERLRKEIEDKDHELVKQYNDEEKVAQPELIPAQALHSMKMRNKNKRKAVATVMKLAERSGLGEIQPVGQNEEPLDEEEEDTIRLNRRKKKAVEYSIAIPSSRPIAAQPSRPSRPVSGGFGFNKRTPGISSVFTGWRIDAERRDKEWKAREEEERKRKDKEDEKGDHPILSLSLSYEQFTYVWFLFQNSVILIIL